MWEKYRGELDAKEINFGPRLGAGETISTVGTVRITRKDTGAVVTPDFAPVGTASGTSARITFQSAIGAAQAPGGHRVYVEVATSGGRLLAQEASLYVKGAP